MTGDIRDSLAERDISLRRYEPGEHRAPCPWCDRGPRDDALAVRVDQDGATWICHRCGEKGGTRTRQDRSPRPQRLVPTPEPEPGPERHETLSDWGHALWADSGPSRPASSRPATCRAVAARCRLLMAICGGIPICPTTSRIRRRRSTSDQRWSGS